MQGFLTLLCLAFDCVHIRFDFSQLLVHLEFCIYLWFETLLVGQTTKVKLVLKRNVGLMIPYRDSCQYIIRIFLMLFKSNGCMLCNLFYLLCKFKEIRIVNLCMASATGRCFYWILLNIVARMVTLVILNISWWIYNCYWTRFIC